MLTKAWEKINIGKSYWKKYIDRSADHTEYHIPWAANFKDIKYLKFYGYDNIWY